MSDADRTQLKKKVEDGQARHADLGRTTIVDRAGEAAIEAKDKFVAFAKEHPVATVAGGLALGVLISSLFKRSPTRRAARKAAGFAAMGAELALAYAHQAMDAAQDAGRAGAKRLDGFGHHAAAAGRSAAHRAADVGDHAIAMTRDAGQRLSKAVRSRVG